MNKNSIILQIFVMLVMGVLLCVCMDFRIRQAVEPIPAIHEPTAEQPVDSSWMWTDTTTKDSLAVWWSHGMKPRTTKYACTYHTNGLLALSLVIWHPDAYRTTPDSVYVYYSNNGKPVAHKRPGWPRFRCTTRNTPHDRSTQLPILEMGYQIGGLDDGEFFLADYAIDTKNPNSCEPYYDRKNETY